VFEAPCVAYAATLDDIPPLARAGADFIAFGERIWDSPDGPAAELAAAAEMLAVPQAVA
jgi:thiamine-phosphate pyrophosphorylase